MPTILLIEDDDLFRTVLSILLTESGYEVWDAPNGFEGIKLYEQHHPDLVITDLVMPEKEGLELIMDLRRRDQGLKIIAMSGGGQVSAAGYLPIAQRLGALCTLTKPFTNAELLEAIRQALAAAA